MPKVKCYCDHVINLSLIPCPDEWLFISDEQYDQEFQGQIDAETLYRAMNSFLLCPNCRRLLVFWDGYDFPAEVYVPEKGFSHNKNH